ncbi:MAG TPA: adenylate/guanylate cyclase domain-containing protein [Gaiellaceae bacterium]|nr:adenylate/guanylate cyclase domain-containing protein [Gaiellaceae bacterium]
MPRLTAAELASRAGQPPALVERLVALAILRPREPDAFGPGDVAVVRLLAAFEESGIALEDLAEGVASGEIDYGVVGRYFSEAPAATGTVDDLARRVNRPPELVVRLLGALGLPVPGPGAPIRDDEAETVAGLVHAWELLDDEELVRLARFQGDAMRKVATVNIRFFEELVRQRVFRMDVTWEEGAALVEELGLRATVFSRTLVDRLYGRHFEHALIQYMADNTEDYLDERGIRARPARRPPAIAFLDLSGFTSLTEERGDTAAAALASRLALVVAEASRSHGGQAVKWLGDGVMFHFDDPAAAVRCALELVRRAREALEIPARVGVNSGPVVFQDGDYFGRTVNVAARIADYARPGEVLVSRAVVAAGAPGELDYEPIGEIPLKGVGAPVELLRARPR